MVVGFARLGCVLSIGKLAAGPAPGRYYVEQVAQGREDYYAGEGEAPGAWMGSGAAALGLAGEVDEVGLSRLLRTEDPASGEALRRPVASGAVAGFDRRRRPSRASPSRCARPSGDRLARLRCMAMRLAGGSDRTQRQAPDAR